jgi:hypothetical protein
MSTLKEKIIEQGLTEHVLTDRDLRSLLDNTPAARYALINKALKKKELINIRRGLYILSAKYRHKILSSFFLANRIVPHSYISLESALSYYGWIPERVTTVTSIQACGRSKNFSTPFGEFVFYQPRINEYEFLTGVIRTQEIIGEPFFLASPLRLLADYIYLKKIEWEGIEYFTDNLRIEIEQLLEIDFKNCEGIKKVYASKRVDHFLDKLRRELKK